MTHACGRTRSVKEKSSNLFGKPLKTADTHCCSMNRASAECKCSNQHCKTSGWTKMKRLKSRKERSNARGLVKEHFKPKSHLQHCHHQRSKDRVQRHNCCLHGHHCPTRNDAAFPDVVPAVHKPSIITDSRLIGHQGLFSHEVKSIDIERLLSEQRKQETSEQQVHKRSNAASQPSSTLLTPSPFSLNGLLCGEADVDVKIKNKPHTATNARDDCQEKENSSDLTPWQKPQQLPDRSPGSYKSILSSQQLTPTVDREDVKTPNKKVKHYMCTNLERTRKNQEFPVSQTQACSLRPSPVSSEPLNSPTVCTLSSQQRRQDPDDVSKSVRTLEAGLCDNLRLPLLRRRSLLSESKGALLKALQKRHGPQLQENLLLVQQHLEDAKKVQDQVSTVTDVPLPTDELRTMFEAKSDIQSQFETHSTSGGWGFNWKSSPQLHCNLKHTAAWTSSPVKTSGNLLDEIFRPPLSPQYCMDFEPSGAAESDQLFACSSLSNWEDKASPFQQWENKYKRPKVRETLTFGSLENSFMSFNREGEGSQYKENNFQPFLRHHVKLPDQHLAGSLLLSPEQDPIETDRYLFTPPSKGQAPHPLQCNRFHPFTQFSHLSACSPLRPHCTDAAHYSRSHMHEKEPAHPFSTFSSPEQWHFRPMWLF